MDPVAAMHDVLRRLSVAEATLQLIAAEWADLEPTDRMRIDRIAPNLTGPLCQTETHLKP